MDKIKVKDKVEKGIKTIDKRTVQAQKIKNNVITTKEKIGELSKNDNAESINSYGTTKIQNAESIAIRDSIYKGNQMRKKSFEKTKVNVSKAKNKIQNHRNKKVKEKLESQIKNKDNGKIYIKGIDKKNRITKLKSKQIKKANSENLLRKTIKTIEMTSKIGQKIAKETEKDSPIRVKRIEMAIPKVVKSAEVIKKTVLQTVKVVDSVTRTIISFIIAGSWGAVIVIIVMCVIGAVFGSISGSEDDISNISSKCEYVMVAKSQIGNVGGEKFWKWYGFEERVEWCAIFVSWCAEQTGEIEKGNIPRYSACSDGMAWFKSQNKYIERKSELYIPRVGDIIFFDWIDTNGMQDGVPDHTGIVERVDIEKNRVYTIEGNSGDACKEQSYSLDSTQIMGYGIPNV